MEKKPPHDSAYKYLFSNRRVFHELLTSFVPEAFVRDIRLEDLHTVDKSFVSEEFINRESDIIYRVKRGKREVYIYILLEFQSTLDKFMAARLLSYIMRLYESFLINSKAGKLPAIFPIVLYNGFEQWRVPDNIADLIEHTIGDYYIPRFRFFRIIEKDIPDDVLFKLGNLIAAVVYLEKQRNASKLSKAIAKIVEMIKYENLVDVKQFTKWAVRMLSFKDKDVLIEEIRDNTEVKPMLTQLAEQLRAEGEAKGEARGEARGKVIGEAKGKLEKARETAKKMREKNFPIEEIIELTGLSRKEIEEL